MVSLQTTGPWSPEKASSEAEAATGGRRYQRLALLADFS